MITDNRKNKDKKSNRYTFYVNFEINQGNFQMTL